MPSILGMLYFNFVFDNLGSYSPHKPCLYLCLSGLPFRRLLLHSRLLKAPLTPTWPLGHSAEFS